MLFRLISFTSDTGEKQIKRFFEKKPVTDVKFTDAVAKREGKKVCFLCLSSIHVFYSFGFYAFLLAGFFF